MDWRQLEGPLTMYVFLPKVFLRADGSTDRCRRVCTGHRVVLFLAHRSHSRLLLGGGFGWLSPAHGLVIDNLIQVCPGSQLSSCLLSSPLIFRQPLLPQTAKF